MSDGRRLTEVTKLSQFTALGKVVFLGSIFLCLAGYWFLRRFLEHRGFQVKEGAAATVLAVGAPATWIVLYLGLQRVMTRFGVAFLKEGPTTGNPGRP